MNVTFALNSVFGPFLVAVLIFADSARKHAADTLQRGLFSRTLVLIVIPLLINFFALLFEGSTARGVQTALWIITYAYLVFKAAAYWHIFIFCVYAVSKNAAVEKLLYRAALIIITAMAVLLLFNFKTGFYYTISENNMFTHGNNYAIRIIAAYLPAVCAPIAIIKTARALRKTLVFLMLMLFLCIGLGTTIDIFTDANLFALPCIAGMLLYLYFFIIREDAKIDSLTGIGNRYAFDEFIDRLAHTETKETWFVMMIDLDHFKMINDVHGHAVGDMALQDIAALIKNSSRGSDFSARYGGDEFVVAVNGERDFFHFLDNFKKTLAAYNASNKRCYKIEISYGYDMFITASGQIIQDFIERIDSLMYKDKIDRRAQRTQKV